MRAGTLRERVQIQTRSTTPDTQGGRAVTWVDLISGSASVVTKLWASVLPEGGTERVAAAAQGAVQRFAVVIRYRADVTPAMRLSWTPFGYAAAKTLQIHTVQPLDGGRVFLMLACSEVK